MEWARGHPRVVRGAAIHESQKEKEYKKRIKNKIYEETTPEIEQEETEGGSLNPRTYETPLFRETNDTINVETLIAPEIENFVETPEIKLLKDKVKKWLNAGHPVHLIGPTGCGKTTLAIKVAKEMNNTVLWINGDEEMSTSNLIGGYSNVETHSLRDNYVHNVLKTRDIYSRAWIDNPLTLACKNGYALVYNEFARSMPHANNVLLSVFEEKVLELPTKSGQERYVKVHPDFVCLLTSNSIEYAGIHRPQDALLDRMIGIFMDYYDFETEVEIVKAHSKIPDAEAAMVVTVIKRMRDKLEDGEKPGTRACVLLAQGLEASGSFEERDYKDTCLDVLASKVSGKSDFDKKSKFIDEVLQDVLASKVSGKSDFDQQSKLIDEVLQ